ncbi:MAG: flagellar hook capping protein [Agathobacter sp.]|nr:flagellar hook capping protein [Agathobacter sp.]
MAITAKVEDGKLNYNYTDSGKKTASNDMGYDQFLQLLCAEMQYQDPLEPTSNTDYVAQLATFSQLEATLGLQTTQDNNFASTLVGKEVILAETDNSGNTKYVTGTVDYVMYENGTPYLSVNNKLYPFSDLDTIAENGYYEAATLSKTFSTMVATLPSKDKITADYEGAVKEVRELYDGMTDYQKKFVDSDALTTLETLEKKIKELIDAKNSADAGSTSGSEDTSGTTDADDVTDKTE